MSFLPTDDYDELRKRWLNRYLTVQARMDTKIRSILVSSSEDAMREVSALEKSSTFSNGVRTAQLKLLMDTIRPILYDIFKREIPIIVNGQKESAATAVRAFAETDKDYLRAAFQRSGDVDSFIDSQRQQAMSGVVHALSRINKSDQPLSTRVYKTRSLANNWVKRQVNSGILRGSSAKQIAFTVRQSIRPTVPGGVSYAAMRLGRTELNNAFHATSIDLAQDRPWIEGMRWNLSKVHDFESGAPEICEVYAHTGIFHVDKVPKKPHPQCRCFVTPEVEPFETFLTHLTAGQYRDWMDRNAA